MKELQDSFKVAAIDLPGVGKSVGRPRDADKRALARCVEAAIKAAGLERITLVGHDVGGQIEYAYLRECPRTIERAAILDVVIPGIDPWEQVIRNPQVWHFAFHALRDLPERLVSGRQAAYFDFFFDAISANPAAPLCRLASSFKAVRRPLDSDSELSDFACRFGELERLRFQLFNYGFSRFIARLVAKSRLRRWMDWTDRLFLLLESNTCSGLKVPVCSLSPRRGRLRDIHWTRCVPGTAVCAKVIPY